MISKPDTVRKRASGADSVLPSLAEWEKIKETLRRSSYYEAHYFSTHRANRHCLHWRSEYETVKKIVAHNVRAA